MPRYIAYDGNKVEYSTYRLEGGNVNIHEWLIRNVGPMDAVPKYGNAWYDRHGQGWRMVTKREIRGKTRIGGWVEFDDSVPEEIILYFALRWS